MTFLINLQSTQNGQIDMAASDKCEGHGAIEGAGAREGCDGVASRVGEPRLDHAFLWTWSRSDQPVLRLEKNL